jgi:nitrite reductase/ring-hydroxylating ferredoxin subunit
VSSGASSPNGGIRVASASDVEEGKFLLVNVGNVEIGVTRVGDRYYAVRNICPHQHAPICLGKVMATPLPSDPGDVRYDASKHVLVCQRHQWEFSLDSGEVVYTTAKGRIRTYAVSVEDDDVFVDLGPRARREAVEA